MTLARYRVPPAVATAFTARGRLWAVQSIFDATDDVANIDCYPVVITRMPRLNGQRATARELLAHIRAHFADYVADSAVTFRPYPSAADAARWTADDPTGAVLRFGITPPGLEPAKFGASVLVSCADTA